MDSSPTVRDLVIGTHNRKKGAELTDMLAPWGFQVVTLADLTDAIEIVEDGDSFAGNAILKAGGQAKHLGRWVLAEDSGLMVDALDGAPGIYSARFAATWGSLSETAEHIKSRRDLATCSTDELNNARLLEQLADTPLEKRTAHYVCHAAVADPSGTICAESHDTCRGRIRFEAAGTNGFGYDPLFEVVEYHRTFGQLGPTVKRTLSHRSRALRAILPKLLALLQ